MEKPPFLKHISVVLFLLLPIFMISQSSVSGKVVDDNSGTALFGANLVIEGTTKGTTTDQDGSFVLSSSERMPWRLKVSFNGYESKILEIEQATSGLIIRLEETFFLGQEVIISASRKEEKIQDAPASISVLGKRQLSVSAQIDPVRNLITVPGVQLQQQTGGTFHVSMRGQGNLFDTDFFPIMDYRSLIGPGIGAFFSSGSGISSVDLERIEVVRGPGGALYGPAVTAGIVHFITKSPIDYPGTSIELIGGEANTYGFFTRHAGKSKNGKVGYKINAQYNRGDEFKLDPVEDADQIAKLKNTIIYPVVVNGVIDASQPGEVILGPEDTDSNGDGNPIQDHYWSTSINGTLEYRPQDDMNLTLSGGMNQYSLLIYNAQGEGLTQSREFWTQARIKKGGFFAQVFYVDNDGGPPERPTFLYQNGLYGAIARKQIEGQVQYNFELPSLLNADISVGFDTRTALSETRNLLYGRYEDDDDYNIYGGYVQGSFMLGDQWDMILAGRYDRYNFNNEGSLTPRLGLVYKPDPQHTIRLTYNKATRPPSALDLNLDFPLATPVPGLLDLWTVGIKEGHEYIDPVIDVTIPGVPDLPIGTPGLPLAIPYAFVNEAVIAGIAPALEGDPDLSFLIPIISAYLRDPANIPQDFTGMLNAYNIFTNQPFGELIPTKSAQVATYTNYELGYKGVIGNKLSITADLYHIRRKGFTLFDAVGPTYSLSGADIPNGLGNAVETGLIPYLTEVLTPSLGGNAAEAAAALAAQIGTEYHAAGVVAQAELEPLFGIFGTTESNLIPQGDGIAHVPVGFRSDPDRTIGYWGAELALEYYFNDHFSVYGNYSWKNRVNWGPAGTEGIDAELPFAFSLIVPKNKYRLGITYNPDDGLFGSISFQHDDAFYGQVGQFQGLTASRNIFDGAVGYHFSEKFKVTLTATNLFDTPYRAFNNFPEIRRRAVVKLFYNISQ